MPHVPEFRLGTDQRQPPTGSGDWWVVNTTGLAGAFHRLWDKVSLGIMSAVGPDGARGMYPKGIGHAVPAGTDKALCGQTGLHLWEGLFNPSSRVVTPCSECAALSAVQRQPGAQEQDRRPAGPHDAKHVRPPALADNIDCLKDGHHEEEHPGPE